VIVVDVANVMGARPDGWWRDRAGAARRLLAQVTELAARGVTADQLPAGFRASMDPLNSPDQPAQPDVPRLDWVLVLEGQARAAATPVATDAHRVRVVNAQRSGDDEIVNQAVQNSKTHACLVVTADRELRRRCEAVGATVAGPSWLMSLL
jgi:hypothetical protein